MMGNCESRNAGTRNGTRNRNNMQSALEIKWARMCTWWTRTWLLVQSPSLLVSSYIAGSGATAKSVRQSVSLGHWSQVWSYHSNSVWQGLWWWFHPSKESDSSVSVSSFCILHQVSTTTEIISHDACMNVVMYCSLAKLGRLICIVRSWAFRFAMIISVRAKQFTGSSGKMALDLSECFSRIGCWAYGGWLCCYTK